MEIAIHMDVFDFYIHFNDQNATNLGYRGLVSKTSPSTRKMSPLTFTIASLSAIFPFRLQMSSLMAFFT